jgi:hypothetical protein
MRAHLIALSLACASCGAGEGPNDAGMRPDLARMPPLLPDPPALPVIAPCPDGWREVAGLEGVAECDPWPETGYEDDCAFDEAHRVGTPACARVGTACATDGWPSDLPTDRPIVYVDDGAAAGGDGASPATAYSSIATAVASAPADAVIAIATGTYDVVVAVGEGQTLWGACVSGTRLTSSTPHSEMTVVGLTGAGSGVRNLGFDAPERTAIVVFAADTTIEDVAISSARVVAISVTSGSASARRVVVRDTRERVEDGRFGNGISVAPGATLTLEDAVLERNRNGALGLAGAAPPATVRRTVLADTFAQAADDRFGHGLATLAGSNATLDACAIERNQAEGLFATGVGTVVSVSRSVLRDTMGQASDDGFGRGADAIGGASLELSRTLASGNLMGGLYSAGAGTSLVLTDVVVRDTREQTSDGRFGFGLHIADSSLAVISRVLVAESRTAGAYVSGGSLTGADLTIADTQSQASDTRFGRGMHATEGGDVDLDRVRIARSREAGLSAIGSATLVSMSHVSIEDTRAQEASSIFGVGMSVEDGATVSIDIVRVETVLHFGGRAMTGGELVLSELTMADIQSNPSPEGGFGLVAQDGAVGVSHFAIDGAAECAYLIGPGASVDLARGDVTSTPVGACMQNDGYDTSRLHDDVVYSGGVAQSETTFVLPEALPLL